MPSTTALRRLSALVVGALFAVAFVVGGASVAQVSAAQGQTLIGAHISASSSHAHAIQPTPTLHELPAHVQLISTGPDAEAITAVGRAIERTIGQPAWHVITISTNSERAPPAI